LIVLILLLLLLGGGGLLAPALHILWILLVIGLILWVLGFFIRSAEGRGALVRLVVSPKSSRRRRLHARAPFLLFLSRPARALLSGRGDFGRQFARRTTDEIAD